MNESTAQPYTDKVRFTSLQPALEYDAYENCLYQIMTEDDCLLLDLEPGRIPDLYIPDSGRRSFPPETA